MEDNYPDSEKDMKIEALKESIIQVTDEKLSWEEIKRRVAAGDIVYIIALNIAKRKIDELENRKTTAKATHYSSIFEATQLISFALITIYMGLSFFQKPSWCRGDPVYQPGNNEYYPDCRGTRLEGEDVIPVSNLPYLESWQLIILEVVCVTLLTARRYVKQVVKKKTSFTLFYSVCGVTILIYLSEILQYVVGIRFPLNQFLRPVYFLLYSKAVRSNVRLYCRIFWRSREIFITIAGIFFFFVCLAKVLFYQTSQNAPGVMNFDTFGNTVYNLFVALTTANYPDLMMPIFQEYRIASLYFIVFMVLLYVILLNIILAYFYFNYKEELIKEIRSFQRNNTKMIGTLFDINAGVADSPVASPNGTALLNKEETTRIFEEIGRIHRAEVKKIFSNSRWKKVLMETLEAGSIRAIFALGSLLVFGLLVIQSCVVSPQPQSSYTPEQIEHNRKFNEVWLIIELCLNTFLLIDPLIRAITIGWKYFIEVWFYVFELSLSIIILILIVTKLWIEPDISMTVVRVILIFRVLRFFRWVVSFEKYHLIYDTLIKLVPLFLDLLGVLTIAFYVYSTLGTVLFGGYLKTNLDINFSQYGDPSYYVYVNFNDFAQGLYTCVHLLIVNNWLYTVDAHCRALGSFNYRIFFVSFYIIVVIICLNIMIAFILDIYVTQISIKHRKMGISHPIDQPTYANLDDNGKPVPSHNIQSNTWEFNDEGETSPFVKTKSNKSKKYTELSPTFRGVDEKEDL